MSDQKAIEARQRQFISDARNLMKPSAVKQGKIPGWLYKALVAARKAGKIKGGRGANAFALLSLATSGQPCGVASWLDHWGSAKWGGVEAFVSEPYDMEGLEKARALADMLGIEMAYSANSWWYPGWTFRIGFYPKKEIANDV